MVWQPPNRAINLVIIILLFCTLVSTVSADSTNPPGSITICGYVTYANEIGIWWFNPYDPDFGGVEMWLDDVFIGNTSSGDHFYNAYSAIVGTHTFSTHTFDNSGNVNTTWVNLTFMTKEYPGCTENWTCDTCSRPVIPGAIANFTQNTTEGLTPLEVQFTDTSTGSPAFWNWSFGDGTYSDIQDVIKTYSTGGYYEINLTVWNENATQSSKLGYVDVWNRTSNNFTANQTSGNVPFSVQFTDTSFNATNWFWIFDGFNTSTNQSPTFEYAVPGIYSVNHSSSNAHDTFWTNKSDYITAYPSVVTVPVANFTGIPISGTAPLTVNFTDLSTGFPTSWNWSFGDGGYNTSRNPLHTYAFAGTFNVSLNATNSAGSNISTRNYYITVSATPTVTPTLPTITPTQPTIKPTQTSGEGDGDSGCFNPSIGGASETGGKAGETITMPFVGNQGADLCVPVAVVEISIIPAVNIPSIMVSAEKANIGPATQIPGNPRAYYLDINWYWVRDADIKDVYITFSVDEGWMKQQGIAPENLVMMRYYDNSWHEIPTHVESHSNGRYYYIASASGVSYFAVTYKGALVPSALSTLTSQITIPQQTVSESKTIEPTRFANLTTVPKTPVKTTTTVPPISSEEPCEIPILWIIIGIGAFIGFVLIILLVRRWWIRRQNPALFRKYD
jgi:PGF-pre-PGF domain-containing protein